MTRPTCNGLDLMEDRQYKDALVILSDYNDYNTAICLMSLGYDARAAGILESLPESSNVCYLLSILYSRLKDDGKAVSSFMRSLELDGSKAYRGRLDPEINRLITTYNLKPVAYMNKIVRILPGIFLSLLSLSSCDGLFTEDCIYKGYLHARNGFHHPSDMGTPEHGGDEPDGFSADR